jgi:hypothetical protein
MNKRNHLLSVHGEQREDQAITLKQECRDLGVNYWRALKRREAGMSREKTLNAAYVRGSRYGVVVTVSGVTYPNLEDAARSLKSPASTATIGRWLRSGMTADEAFSRTPNPGYNRGIIYMIFNLDLEMGYIGQTVQTLEMRVSSHWDAVVSGAVKDEESLHAALRKYGAESFLIAIIDRGTSLIDLGERERKQIELHGTLAPNGFNICPGGSGGGSNPKPRTYKGMNFKTTLALIEYVAEERGISLAAAKKRVQFDRIEVRTPAKAGTSLANTSAYKAWSRIIHGAVNPASKSFKPGLTVCDRWRTFNAFFQDVGQPPCRGMAFTRLDQAQGFCPDNCQWLTKSEASQINAAYMKSNGTLVGNRRRHD